MLVSNNLSDVTQRILCRLVALRLTTSRSSNKVNERVMLCYLSVSRPVLLFVRLTFYNIKMLIAEHDEYAMDLF